jgi:3-hydroxyisobutyrate dehydrogenase-like beta-hydroxyacid dehydrogenase
VAPGSDLAVGVVNPGAMGAAVAATLARRGLRVVVALEGRSAASKDRAARYGLHDVGTLERLVMASELVLSIVPPASALEVAEAIARLAAATGRTVTLLDANAVSPMRALEIASVLEVAGGRYLDGGIVGGPPSSRGRTDLYVSGEGADDLAPLLGTDELAVISLGPDPTAASALKMCFAAWSKGTTALAIEIRALARAHRLDEALLALWGRRRSGALEQSEGAGGVAGRAWRWVDEMAEIQLTFEEAGLPGGAAGAASLLYDRLAGFKDRSDVSLEEILATLAEETTTSDVAAGRVESD